MKRETIELHCSSPGTLQSLQFLRFGTTGARPKVYVQAALHADEVPAILVAQQLAKLLEQLETQGAITGEIVLVPCANPIGLAQISLGIQQGRFDQRDGINFNRGFTDFAELIVDPLRPLLTNARKTNTDLIRGALVAVAASLEASSPAQDLKNNLLRLAIDADIVLDLHCDGEAVMHVYALTPQKEAAEILGAAMGARAVLLATDSGDSPFDEACTRPWLQLQQLLPEFPIELACFGATVELRGESDTDHTLSLQDAHGLVTFLAQRGVLTKSTSVLPQPLCSPTLLSCSEPITAPCSGVVVFHCKPGNVVEAGDLIADLVDASTGSVTPVRCKSSGLVYACCGSRWAYSGKRLSKIAGNTLERTGKLLSP